MIALRTLGTLKLHGPLPRDYDAVLAQPKRLLLLVRLALAHREGLVRRDTLVGLFWPDLDAVHARSALRQSLTFLRRALGDDVLFRRGSEEIGVNEAALETDAVLFDRACDAGDLSAALELYRGDLLEGVFVSDIASDLERWVEDERARLRQRAVDAAWKLAARVEAEGNLILAAEHARRAFALSPEDESGLRRLLALLDRAMDYDGATRVYETFARRLAHDMEVAPAVETTALMTRMRARMPDTPHGTRSVRAPGNMAPPVRTPAPADSPPKGMQAVQRWPATIAVVLLAAAATVLAVRPRRPPPAEVTATTADPVSLHPAARDSYLKARFALDQGTLASVKAAAAYLKATVRADTAFAQGYALLALTHMYMPMFGEVAPNDAYPRAQAAAIRALEIDPTVAEGTFALAYVSAYFHWEWKESDRLFRRALDFAPDNAELHVAYGDFLSSSGRLRASVAEYERAKAIDPSSRRAINNLARRLIWMGDYIGARRELDAVLKLEPGYARAHRTLGVLHIALGRFDDAIAELRQARDLSAGRPFDLSALAQAYVLAGHDDQARGILDDLRARATREYVPPYAIATVYAILGEKDAAFAWLDRAVEAHDSSMSHTILYESMLDSLRDDPRFAVVLRRMRLGA